MAHHPVEINHSSTGDSGPPLAGSHLADSSLANIHAARTAMESPALPSEFGNVSIDFSSDRRGSEGENRLMTAANPENLGKIKDPNPGILPSKPGDVVIIPLDPGGALLIGHDGTIIHVPKK